VRGRYDAVSDRSGTLESLVLSEGVEAHKNATPCLVRLIRYVRAKLPYSMSNNNNVNLDIPLFLFLFRIHRLPRHFLLSNLLQYLRGLAFTCKALQNMQNDTSSELHTCFKRSYDEVLRHHHTFFIRSVVSVSSSVYFLLFFFHPPLHRCVSKPNTCVIGYLPLCAPSWFRSIILGLVMLHASMSRFISFLTRSAPFMTPISPFLTLDLYAVIGCDSSRSPP